MKLRELVEFLGELSGQDEEVAWALWNREDVAAACNDKLTPEQADTVLLSVYNYYDADDGITWREINETIVHLYPDLKDHVNGGGW